MNCPVDNTTLVMSDRQGIEIDYCPQCRGVWLDRGELDKIIDRSASESSASHAAPVAPSHRPDDRRDGGSHYDDRRSDDRSGLRHDDDHGRRYDDHDSRGHGDHRKKHKREGFLGDIFDFGD